MSAIPAHTAAPEVIRYFKCTCRQYWNVDETYEQHFNIPADKCPECGKSGKLIRTYIHERQRS